MKTDSPFKKILIGFLATLLIFAAIFSAFCCWLVRENRKYIKEYNARCDSAVLKQIEEARETGRLSLTYYEISMPNPGYDLATPLRNARGMKEIETIRLEGFYRGPVPAEIIEILGTQENLESVSFKNFVFRDDVLTPLTRLSRLKRIALNRCRLDDTSCKILSNLENLHDLAFIFPGHFPLHIFNEIDDESLQVNRFLEFLATMRHLNSLVLVDRFDSIRDELERLLPETRLVFVEDCDYFDERIWSVEPIPFRAGRVSDRPAFGL